MKTLRKRLALLCMLVIAAVTVGLFAACNNNPNNSGDGATTYTVLVEDDAHTPLKDVSVYLKKGNTRYNAVKTGTDGKATIELAADTYDVAFIESTIPDGYSVPENVQVTAESPSVTVTLVKDFRYVVNLVDESGNPFYRANVMLAICQLDGSCLTPSPLGTDGKWTYTGADPGDYKVQIVFPPEIAEDFTYEGYTATNHYYSGEHFSATLTEITVVIKAVPKSAYTIEVVNPDNTPASGVYVNLESSASSLTPAQTGADGKAVIAVPSYGVYSVTAVAPDGLTFDTGAYKTNANDREITVKLNTLNALAFDDAHKMDADGTAEYANGFSQFAANTLPLAYSYKSTFGANETKYYVFTALSDEDYVIYCKKANTVFKFCSDGTNYTDGEEYSTAPTLAQGLNTTNGGKVYFSATAADAGELEFVIAAPTPNYSTKLTVTAAGTYPITVDAAANYATVSFTPSRTGIYEITSEGNYDTRVEYYANAITMFKTGENDDISAENKNFKLGEIEIQSVGGTSLFRIYVKEGATFPATFNVKVNRTGDAQVIVNRETKTVTPAQLSQAAYADGNGRYYEVDLADENVSVVKGADGYYRLDSANGPVLVVKLAQSFRNFGIFSYTQSGGRAIANTFFMAFADHDDETTFWDYTSFVESYSQKCNFDGVYGVNDELKLMLERWAKAFINQHTLAIDELGTIASGNEWLIPCGYYVATALNGEGTTIDPYRLDIGAVDITLPAGTPVYIAMEFGEFTVNVLTDKNITFSRDVTATPTEGGYTFNCESTRLGITMFSITNNESSAITVNVNVTEQKADQNNTVLALGSNPVTIASSNVTSGVEFTFTPETGGVYVISSTGEDSYLLAAAGTVYPAGDNKQMGFAVTVNAVAGETYTILLSSSSLEGGEYTVDVNERLTTGENEVTVTSVDGTGFSFSTPTAGKYLIYSIDENGAVFYHDAFKDYNGDTKEGEFAFVLDCAANTDYYFVLGGKSQNKDAYPVDYFVNIVKLEDATLKVGDNNVTCSMFGDLFAFTPEADGTYKISSDSEIAFIYSGFNYSGDNGAIDVTINAKAGKTYYFILAFNDTTMNMTATYTVNIEEVQA